MSTTAKAVGIRDQIAASLALRMPAIAGVKSFSAASGHIGDPLLTLGTIGTGNQCAIVRVATLPSAFSDIIGHDQAVYATHVVQVVMEANAVSDDPALADTFIRMTNWSKIWGSVVLAGVRVELYVAQTGTSSAEADMVAAQLATTFDPLPEGPLAGQ